MKKAEKRMAIRAAKRAQHGDALVYLTGKLLEIERAEWRYENETIPALNHAAEQRARDRHSIQTTLAEGDFGAIVRLARAFQADAADVFPVSEDDIPL